MKIHSARTVRSCAHTPRVFSIGRRRNEKAIKKQRGFDLIQLGLVVALIGVLMSGALLGVPKLLDRIKATHQADDLRSFVTLAQASLSLFTPAEIVTKTIRDANLYPGEVAPDAGVTDAKYLSRFTNDASKSIVITAQGDANRTVTVALKPPTSNSCLKVGSELALFAETMTVANTPITKDKNRLKASEIASGCAKIGTTVTIGENDVQLEDLTFTFRV
jgi:type II secretory pathway pseudopilin PulG